MARILVQTDDHRTVLEAGNVHVADINDQETCVRLLDRLERAIHDSERRLVTPNPPVRHMAGVAPARDYREVGD
jgi:hypothetical protein